jgi:hypothetical protein
MNKRIKQLSEDADRYARAVLAEYRTMGNTVGPDEYNRHFRSKLSELIVLDCIDCCRSVLTQPIPPEFDTAVQGVTQAILEIEERFERDE